MESSEPDVKVNPKQTRHVSWLNTVETVIDRTQHLQSTVTETKNPEPKNAKPKNAEPKSPEPKTPESRSLESKSPADSRTPETRSSVSSIKKDVGEEAKGQPEVKGTGQTTSVSSDEPKVITDQTPVDSTADVSDKQYVVREIFKNSSVFA